MNLRVDLILESEQRSGSVISSKSIIRISSIVFPSILAIILIFAFVNSIRLKNELAMYIQEMDIAGPRQEQAIKLRDQLKKNLSALDELNSWNSSHMDWHEQLLNLQKEVPPRIQLTDIDVKQVLQIVEKKIPARVFTLMIKGKAKGATSEGSIQFLYDKLKNSPSFASFTDNVDVSGSADTTKGADKNDRTFRIDCAYKPRKFTK